MEHLAYLTVGLLIAILFCAILARRLHVPYPIALLIGGILVSFIPALPHVQLNPDLVFLTILPPILFAGGYLMPFQLFKRNITPISFLALGLVVATTAAVAWVGYTLWDFPIALGCVLGAIVSPPDAIAATAIIQRLRVNTQVATIIEGESLVNDASALTIYRLALATLIMHQFSIVESLVAFIAICGGGIAIGWLAAFLALRTIRKLDEPTLTIAGSIVLPYLTYIVADSLGLSGVLATVTAGLYAGRHMTKAVSPLVRIEAMAVWRIIVFLLNGVAFILIGLQLPMILHDLRIYSWHTLMTYAIVLNGVLILVRFLWVFIAMDWPKFLSARWKRSMSALNWRSSLLIGWCGMRGVVSLAAALALPFTLETVPFPHRSLIIFLTFSVICVSLLVQGVTLPLWIRKLKLGEAIDSIEHEATFRARTAKAALSRLDELTNSQPIDPITLGQLRARYERKAAWAEKIQQKQIHWKALSEDSQVELDLLRTERDVILDAKDKEEMSEETSRALLNELDFEAARIYERSQRTYTE